MPKAIDLEIAPGVSITHQTPEHFLDFLNSEKAEWAALEKLPTRFEREFRNVIRSQLSRLSEMINAISSSENKKSALDNLTKELSRFKSSSGDRLLCSIIPEEGSILALAAIDPDAAVAGMIVRMKYGLNYQQNDSNAIAFQYAVSRYAAFNQSAAAKKKSFDALFRGAQDVLAKEIAEFSNLKQELWKSFGDLKDERARFAEFQSICSEEHGALLKKHDDEVKRVTSALTEQMALRGPVSYWETQAAARRHASWVWLGIFAAMAIAIVLLVDIFGGSLLQLVTDKSGTINLAGTPLLAAALVPILWILRHVARMFVENVADARDAEFRKNLTSTFLALSEEKGAPITDDMRAIVIHALFRAGPAQQPDDGVPIPLAELLKK